MKVATKIKKRGANEFVDVLLADIQFATSWVPTKIIYMDVRVPNDDPLSDRLYNVIAKWRLSSEEAKELARILIYKAETELSK